VSLRDDLDRVAAAARTFVGADDYLVGVVPTEPTPAARVYLCAFASADGERTWLALDDEEKAITSRTRVREAVAIAALCELAEETAGGGDLDELRARLVALRLTDNPAGVDEAEEAVVALQHTIGASPRLATPDHLDAVGTATQRLEQALGDDRGSPFAEAMRLRVQSVESLTAEIEANYRIELSG
jgi:hypothetical protein